MQNILTKKDRVILVILLISIVVSYGYFHVANMRYVSVTTFDECVTAGYPLLEVYPEVCKMPGKQFVNPRQEKARTTENTKPIDISHKTATYFFEGKPFMITDGRGQLPQSDSLRNGTTTVQALDTYIEADLNNDTVPDSAFILRTSDARHYLAAAIRLNSEYLGLQIVPLSNSTTTTPSLVYKNGELVVGQQGQGASDTHASYIYDKGLLKKQIGAR